jgi:hypothetical protein
VILEVFNCEKKNSKNHKVSIFISQSVAKNIKRWLKFCTLHIAIFFLEMMTTFSISSY